MNKVLFIAILLLSITKLSAQDSWGTTIVHGELKGMNFEAKIDYMLDCAFDTPFVRATLHSIQVTGYTYESEYYSHSNNALSFPYTVEDAYLTLEGQIYVYRNDKGSYINGGTFKLNPAQLSMRIGGNGGALIVDEFRFSDKDAFVDGTELNKCSEVKEYGLSRDLNITDVKDGDFRYNGESLDLLLKRLIKEEEKRKENEALEKKKEDLINSASAILRNYTNYSSSDSPEYYTEGLKKVNEMLSKDEYRVIEKELLAMKDDIQNALNEARKARESKQTQAAEIREVTDEEITDEKSGSQTRLSEEERALGNSMNAYQRSVNTYENQGVNSSAAHEFARNDERIQAIDEFGNQVSQSLSSATMTIIEGIEVRKEEKQKQNRADLETYKLSFEEHVSNIQNVNDEYYEELKNNLPSLFSGSDNIDVLKEEIIWLVNHLGNKKLVTKHEISKILNVEGLGPGPVTVSEEQIILGQKINEAYFTQNKFIVKAVQSCNEATYDMSHLKSVYKYKPLKYDLYIIYTYDLDSKKEEVLYRVVWRNNTEIPGHGNYLDKKDFRNSVKDLNSMDYAVPAIYGRGIDIKYDIIKKLERLSDLNTQQHINSYIEDHEFIAKYNEKVARQLNDFNGNIRYSGRPNPLIILDKNYHVSNNPDENSVVTFWYNDDQLRYMIISFPSAVLFKNLNTPGISADNGKIKPPDSNTSILARINNDVQTFFPSYSYSNTAIGGTTGNDLLLTGQYNQQFEYEFYYPNIQNRQYVVFNEFIKEFNENIWNPYIEIGDVKFYIEYQYIKDEDLKKKLMDKRVNDLPLVYYNQSPQGVLVKLIPEKIALLSPMKIVQLNYMNSIKGNYTADDKRIQSDYLYFEGSDVSNNSALTFYAKDQHYLPLSGISAYEPLYNVSHLSFSKEFLNGFYKTFEEKDPNSSLYSQFGTGTAGTFYEMIDYLTEIDFSEQAKNFKGRKPTYYANGNLKTVGLYKNSKKVGAWDYYNESGYLERIETYDADFSIISKVEAFDENGNKITSENYDAYGILNYTSYYYEPESSILKEVTYNDGLKTHENLYKADNIDDENKSLFETRKYENGILTKTTKH